MSSNNPPHSTGLSVTLNPGTAFRFLLLSVFVLHVLNALTVCLRINPDQDNVFVTQFFVPFFMVSSEGVIPTFYSVCTLLICSLLLLLTALHARQHRLPYKALWFLLSAIFCFLAADEGMEIHERLSAPIQARFNTTGPFLFAWIIPGIGLVTFLALLYAKFLLALTRRTRFLFIASAVLYLDGALGMEMVGSNYRYEYGRTLTYRIIASIEEVFEMLGIAVFIYTLTYHLEQRVKQVRLRIA